MQPFKYITEVASTNTFSPSMSKVLSIIPAAFSNCIEQEKPEQPPPTTPMRRPAGTGLCCPMISFTLETALAVSETGGVFFTSGTLVFTSGTVVVAIRISLALKYLDYTRAWQAVGTLIRKLTCTRARLLDVGLPPDDSSRGTCQLVYNACVRRFLQVEECGLRPAPLDMVKLPNGLQTVEVAYDLDVDSFNAWLGDRVGCFHCRPDPSAHLPQHADHARGRVVVS